MDLGVLKFLLSLEKPFKMECLTNKSSNTRKLNDLSGVTEDFYLTILQDFLIVFVFSDSFLVERAVFSSSL